MANGSRLILFASLLVVAFSGCSRKQDVEQAAPEPATRSEGVVRIAAVGSQVDAARLAEFTKQTGIEVQIESVDSSRGLEARVLAGDSGLDVVILSAAFLQRQVGAGLFQKLGKDRLHNLESLDPALVREAGAHDPGNELSVPYRWRTVALGFDEQRIRAVSPEASLDSWGVLWDPTSADAIQSCGIGLLDSPAVVLKAMLMWMGRDPRSITAEDVDAAAAQLLALQPFIREIGSSAVLNEKLTSGELCLAVTWVDSHGASGAGDVRWSVPKEGSVIQFDVLAIPIDAKQVQSAHELIDFLLQASRVEAGAFGNPTDVPFVAATALSAGIEQDMNAAWTAFLAQ